MSGSIFLDFQSLQNRPGMLAVPRFVIALLFHPINKLSDDFGAPVAEIDIVIDITEDASIIILRGTRIEKQPAFGEQGLAFFLGAHILK